MGFGILSKNSPKTKAPHGPQGIATTNKRGLVHPGVIFGPSVTHTQVAVNLVVDVKRHEVKSAHQRSRREISGHLS